MITDALVDFIAEDLIPLHVVDNKRFRKLVHILDPQHCLPSRKHLSRNLLKIKLSESEAIHLTIDLWSNCQMRSFIGITAHYFSPEWKLQHVILGFNCIRGRHTTENIVIWFDEIISDFQITEQIKHIVTDSGSNIKKAFLSLPGYRNSC